MPTLQPGELKLREVKWFAQDHKLVRDWVISNPKLMPFSQIRPLNYPKTNPLHLLYPFICNLAISLWSLISADGPLSPFASSRSLESSRVGKAGNLHSGFSFSQTVWPRASHPPLGWRHLLASLWTLNASARTPSSSLPFGSHHPPSPVIYTSETSFLLTVPVIPPSPLASAINVR